MAVKAQMPFDAADLKTVPPFEALTTMGIPTVTPPSPYLPVNATGPVQDAPVPYSNRMVFGVVITSLTVIDIPQT
jgi:hypothetical protein